jgi:hypothetical protein
MKDIDVNLVETVTKREIDWCNFKNPSRAECAMVCGSVHRIQQWTFEFLLNYFEAQNDEYGAKMMANLVDISRNTDTYNVCKALQIDE